MAKHTTNRAFLTREVRGLQASVTGLKEAISLAPMSRAQSNHPTIESAPLHRYIREMEDHLVQLKTLTNYRSTP